MSRPLAKPMDEWERTIIESARSLFAETGYEKASVESIMKRAGAAKGSFYRHFDSKEEVLKAIVNDWAIQYAQGIIEVLRDDSLGIEDKTEGILEVVDRMAMQPEGAELFFVNSDKTLALELQDRMVGVLAPELSLALERAKDLGEVTIGSPDFYASFIIHGAFGVLNSKEDDWGGSAFEELRLIVSGILQLEKGGSKRAD